MEEWRLPIEKCKHFKMLFEEEKKKRKVAEDKLKTVGLKHEKVSVRVGVRVRVRINWRLEALSTKRS